MAHVKVLPKVKECKAYIESCGWSFQTYNRPWYIFKGNNGRKTMNGSSEVSFTITELRQAFNNGW